MTLHAITSDLVTLEPISQELARRIVARDERAGDRWHAEYPFEDELAPLSGLVKRGTTDPHFTLYLLRRNVDGLAVGGFGFFWPPDENGADTDLANRASQNVLGKAGLSEVRRDSELVFYEMTLTA